MYTERQQVITETKGIAGWKLCYLVSLCLELIFFSVKAPIVLIASNMHYEIMACYSSGLENANRL